VAHPSYIHTLCRSSLFNAFIGEEVTGEIAQTEIVGDSAVPLLLCKDKLVMSFTKKQTMMMMMMIIIIIIIIIKVIGIKCDWKVM
jgi:hypothetical protein